jgi:hypothetical protein
MAHTPNKRRQWMKRTSLKRTARWAVFGVLALLIWRLAIHVPHQSFGR